MVPFNDILAEAQRKSAEQHAAQDREECRVKLLAHAPDFSVEDRAEMLAALMGAEKPVESVADHAPRCSAPVPDAGRAEAVRGLVKAAAAAQLTLLNIDDRGLANTKPEAVAIGKTTSALLAAWPEVAHG